MILFYFLLSSVKERVGRDGPLEKADDDSNRVVSVVKLFVWFVIVLCVNEPEVASVAVLWVIGPDKVALASESKRLFVKSEVFNKKTELSFHKLDLNQDFYNEINTIIILSLL